MVFGNGTARLDAMPHPQIVFVFVCVWRAAQRHEYLLSVDSMGLVKSVRFACGNWPDLKRNIAMRCLPSPDEEPDMAGSFCKKKKKFFLVLFTSRPSQMYIYSFNAYI